MRILERKGNFIFGNERAQKNHKRDKEGRYGEIGGDWETKAIH
jgi:hypothetical protein